MGLMTGVRLYPKPAPWEAIAGIVAFPIFLGLVLWSGIVSTENGLLILGGLAIGSLFWPKIYRERFRRHPEALEKHPQLPRLYRVEFFVPMITFLVGVTVYIASLSGG